MNNAQQLLDLAGVGHAAYGQFSDRDLIQHNGKPHISLMP